VRTYVIATGVVFGLITVAHVWRLVVEPHLLREPWFMLLTLVAAGLAVAAWRVARRTSPPR
jgi:multisubunit Na+/H+ antiporter MnhE subunit